MEDAGKFFGKQRDLQMYYTNAYILLAKQISSVMYGIAVIVKVRGSEIRSRAAVNSKRLPAVNTCLNSTAS